MTSFRALVHVVAVVSLAGCASSGAGNNSTVAPTPDPRVGLKSGLKDAGQAAWNLRLLTNVPPSEKFVGSTNSDLSFYKNYVIQGNYNGFERSEEHTSELQSLAYLVCRLLLEKKTSQHPTLPLRARRAPARRYNLPSRPRSANVRSRPRARCVGAAVEHSPRE